MACGESCRRLSAGAGITITPDCCGGCVISATGSGGDGTGCACQLAADPVRPGVTVTPGTTPGTYYLGLDPVRVEEPAIAQARDAEIQRAAETCCAKNAGDIQALIDRLNAFPPVPASFLTADQVRQIAEEVAGGLTQPEVQTLIDTAVKQALDDHAAKCHTLTVISTGVTPESGWEVDAQELRTIGGVNTVFIRLTRTGGDLVGVDADFVNSEGKHEEGNIIPDLLIAKVPDDWRPPQTYMAFGDNSYGHGGVRVHSNGDVYLVDWMTNNVIQDGYLLRFEYEFLRQSPCETPDA